MATAADLRAGEGAVAEQGEREHRLLDARLDGEERADEGGGADQLGDDRRARPAVLVAAQQREHEQEQAGGQRELAGHVELAGVGVLRLLDGAARDREADEAQRQVDEEDPAPVETAGERAADERADGERGADRGAVGGERLGALLRALERLREQGERDGEHDRRADALRGARGVEHHDVGRRRAYERGDGEEGKTDREERRRPKRSASEPAVRTTAASASV